MHSPIRRSLMPLLLLQGQAKLRVSEFAPRKDQQTQRHSVRSARSLCSRGPQAIEPSRQFTLETMGKTAAQAVHANAARPIRNSFPCTPRTGTLVAVTVERAISPARN